MQGAGRLELCWAHREDPYEHRNHLWDGRDHNGCELVLCSRFLGMQLATYLAAHLLVPLC